jgi:membrane-associated phospholipid phosphatase
MPFTQISFFSKTKPKKKGTPMKGKLHNWSGIATIALLAAIVFGAPSRADAAATPDPVRAWNKLALDTVRLRNPNLSDAQAARLYAMVNAAMFDAVNGIITRQDADKSRYPALIAPTNMAKGDQYAAASAAAHAVLSGEYPEFKTSMYDPQLTSDLAALGKGAKSDGQTWGAYVGNQVRNSRANDGSTPVESQSPDPDPVGHFRATWSGTQFRNLAPFGIANSSIYVGDGPAPLESLDYAGTWAKLKLIGNAANTDQGKLDTFRFWSLGGGTSQPPGAWIQIAQAVTAANPLPLPEQSRLFALVSMAMADTVAPTVMTKWLYKHWRPATAIREADSDGNTLTEPPEPGWFPRAGTSPTAIGTTPEYWSGHSSFSVAAATALAGFYCADNIPFTFVSDSAVSFNLPARSYSSFFAAAAEAGQSRVVGGIHFEFSNEEGLAAGRAITAEILANKLLVRNGPTHFGRCPR